MYDNCIFFLCYDLGLQYEEKKLLYLCIIEWVFDPLVGGDVESCIGRKFALSFKSNWIALGAIISTNVLVLSTLMQIVRELRFSEVEENWVRMRFCKETTPHYYGGRIIVNHVRLFAVLRTRILCIIIIIIINLVIFVSLPKS